MRERTRDGVDPKKVVSNSHSRTHTQILTFLRPSRVIKLGNRPWCSFQYFANIVSAFGESIKKDLQGTFVFHKKTFKQSERNSQDVSL